MLQSFSKTFPNSSRPYRLNMFVKNLDIAIMIVHWLCTRPTILRSDTGTIRNNPLINRHKFIRENKKKTMAEKREKIEQRPLKN